MFEEIERDLEDPRDHIDYLARCRRRREQAELERADMDFAERQADEYREEEQLLR